VQIATCFTWFCC